MKTIVLTGGGTGGHCIPNLALIEELKKQFDKIVYVGGYDSVEQSLCKEQDIEFYPIHTVKTERRLIYKNLALPFKLHSCKKEGIEVLKRIKPDVVFSKGGYVSIPVVLGASALKIPAVTHESDLTLGLANRVMARKCKYVFTAFEPTAKKVKNGLFTGNPIRKSIFDYDRAKALERFGFKGDKPILLVTGGSSGSQVINDAVYRSRQQLCSQFDIIHVTGRGKGNKINQDDYKQFEFISDMNLALNLADVIVSRGGANTLFEIIALQKPCLVIPLPKGNSRGDQVLNANYFEDKGLIKCLAQENLTQKSLIYNVNQVYKYRLDYINALKKYPVRSGNKIICEMLAEIADGK